MTFFLFEREILRFCNNYLISMAASNETSAQATAKRPRSLSVWDVLQCRKSLPRPEVNNAAKLRDACHAKLHGESCSCMCRRSQLGHSTDHLAHNFLSALKLPGQAKLLDQRKRHGEDGFQSLAVQLKEQALLFDFEKMEKVTELSSVAILQQHRRPN